MSNATRPHPGPIEGLDTDARAPWDAHFGGCYACAGLANGSSATAAELSVSLEV